MGYPAVYREFRHFFPEFVKEWTGVLPTEDEPDVAPVMLPEHATPTGLTVPSIQNSSSRFDYAALHMAHAREMWNVAGPMMAYGNAPPMMPNYGYGIPPVGAAPGVQPAPHRLAAAAAAGAANLPHPHNYVPDMMGAQPVAIPQYRLDRTGEKAGAQKNRQKSNETDGGSAPKRARIGGNQDDAIVLD
uniref:Uncharacterized protein n=1 Tax=Caenorhabditis japonica TaxID=281687 RepID=A0A8R1DEG4_CAEJA